MKRHVSLVFVADFSFQVNPDLVVAYSTDITPGLCHQMKNNESKVQVHLLILHRVSPLLMEVCTFSHLRGLKNYDSFFYLVLIFIAYLGKRMHEDQLLNSSRPHESTRSICRAVL